MFRHIVVLVAQQIKKTFLMIQKFVKWPKNTESQ